MRKLYEEPEFELQLFSFERILEERGPQMNGSDLEGQGAGESWD